MTFKFYLQLFFFFNITVSQCVFIQQDENTLLINRLFSNIKKVARFFFDASDAKSNPDDIIISSEKIQSNNNMPAPNFDDTLLKKMKEEFITRVSWDEQSRLDHYFYDEYKKKYNFYTNKISEYQYDFDINGDVLDAMLSLKFDAIMKTLFIMVNNPEQTEKFGIFNEIFNVIRENNFIIDKKILKPLLNKIIEVMQREQRRVDHKEKTQQGILDNVIRFFIADDNKKEEREDNFEKIFLQYGFAENDLLLYDKLFDERRYNFHARRIEDAIRQNAYSIE